MIQPMLSPSSLPYRDTKPVGAADFYFAINATFRFIRQKLGPDALRDYWSDLGRAYLAPVSRLWKEGGLPALATYWRDFFAAEPGSEVTVVEAEDAVVLEVSVCPAIHHLRSGKRAIDPGFCQHCYFVSEAAARSAGFTVRVKGGNGSCRQTFSAAEIGPQQIKDIKEAA